METEEGKGKEWRVMRFAQHKNRDSMCFGESVEEIPEAVSALDLWQVYNKLLTDFVAKLSPEELEKLKADYI